MAEVINRGRNLFFLYLSPASALHGCAGVVVTCYSLRFDFPAQSIMPESRFLLSVGLSGLTRFASLGRGASVLFLSRSYTSACIQWAHVRPLFLLLAFASPAFLREISSMSMCSLFRRVFGSEALRRPRSVFVGKGGYPFQ